MKHPTFHTVIIEMYLTGMSLKIIVMPFTCYLQASPVNPNTENP